MPLTPDERAERRRRIEEAQEDRDRDRLAGMGEPTPAERDIHEREATARARVDKQHQPPSRAHPERPRDPRVEAQIDRLLVPETIARFGERYDGMFRPDDRLVLRVAREALRRKPGDRTTALFAQAIVHDLHQRGLISDSVWHLLGAATGALRIGDAPAGRWVDGIVATGFTSDFANWKREEKGQPPLKRGTGRSSKATARDTAARLIAATLDAAAALDAEDVPSLRAIAGEAKLDPKHLGRLTRDTEFRALVETHRANDHPSPWWAGRIAGVAQH